MNKVKLGLGLVIVVSSITVGVYFANAQRQPMAFTTSSSLAEQPATEVNQAFRTEELGRLINEERGKAGLYSLTIDQRLDNSADAKCQDMLTRDYVAHDSPDGVTAADLVEAQGIRTRTGENLASGYETESQVLTAWLNSPSHKSLILHTERTHIGMAHCRDDKAVLTVLHSVKL